MSSPNEEAIVARIISILRKAERTESPHEAKVAQELAHRLLLKHGIDEARVRQEAEKSHMGSLSIQATGNLTRWQFLLAQVVAQSVGCLTLKSLGSMILFVGPQSTLEPLLQMYISLRNQLSWRADKAYEQAKLISLFTLNKNSWQYSFLMAACIELDKRLTKNKEDIISEEPDSKALMVVRDAEIDSYIQETFGPVKKSKKRKSRKINQDAVAQGRKAGREVEPHKGLKNG